jgi:MFS transporter, DHA2 family, methylenomycin A resistance protein
MTQIQNSRTRRRLALLASCLGFAVIILDVSVVNVALDRLRDDFRSSVSGLEWVVSGYTLTFAAFLLTSGSLNDRFGSKPVFQVGFVLFALASVACGLSRDLVTLVVGRIAQGVGASLLAPASIAIVNQTFENKEERNRAIGLWAAAGGLALAVGPVFGGLLISQSGWRSIFMVNVPIAALGLWLTAVNAPKTRRLPPRRVDWFGQSTCVLALGGLTAAIIESADVGWSAPLAVGCAALFVVSGTLFLYSQSRGRDPMLPLILFRNRTFAASSAIGVAVNFAFYGLIFMFSLFFQTVWRYTPLDTGLAFLPMTAAIMCANIASGRLAARYGARPALFAGCVIAAVGYMGMAPFVAAGSYGLIALQFVIAGAGIGLAVPAMTNAMLSAVAPSQIGISSGVLNASRQIGGLLGVAATGQFLSGLTPERFATGLNSALIFASLTLTISALLSATCIGREIEMLR